MKTIMMKKYEATAICGGLTQTSKMPCKSYSLPTETCITGFKMSKIAGSICASCYADRGFYSMYAKTIKPAQFARWDSLTDEDWSAAIVALIGADRYFRWHDSGDLQGVWHLEKIVEVCNATPDCLHWLPTREFGIVKQFIQAGGVIPKNLIVRLSAMYVDEPVKIPKSLQGHTQITASNVHKFKPAGEICNAPKQNGECGSCRACWDTTKTVTYEIH